LARPTIFLLLLTRDNTHLWREKLRLTLGLHIGGNSSPLAAGRASMRPCRRRGRQAQHSQRCRAMLAVDS
jgi:hypothetical protein